MFILITFLKWTTCSFILHKKFMKEEKKLLVIKTLRISEELNDGISFAAQQLDAAEQDVIRLAMRIGLAHLKRVKYDLAACVLNESQKRG